MPKITKPLLSFDINQDGKLNSSSSIYYNSLSLEDKLNIITEIHHDLCNNIKYQPLLTILNSYDNKTTPITYRTFNIMTPIGQLKVLKVMMDMLNSFKLNLKRLPKSHSNTH